MKTHFQRPDHLHGEVFPVVTTLFNPARYRSRWKLHEDFEKRVAQAGGTLFVVEVAFGDRAFVLDPGPRVIQLRTSHEIWIKENATNVGVQHVTAQIPGWKKIAWVDADVRFLRDDWVDETKHQLEHYDVVQMWSQFQDVTGSHEQVSLIPSFIGVYKNSGLSRKAVKMHGHRYGFPGAPGLAWACTRKAWDTFGGLLDVGILGAGDWYMAHALLGEASVDPRNHPVYVKAIMDWQEKALLLRKNVGVVPGMAVHFWHGPKGDRKYGTREQILVDSHYDPSRHVSKNAGGILQLTSFAPIELRDKVRTYLHERHEDA